MADLISKERRSWNMSRIGSKNTEPERFVRSILHRLGCRFRLHVRSLPGTPDIVLPRWRTVIFVDGCFWHRHGGCKYAYTPKSRLAFWRAKFRENVQRDKRVARALAELGWSTYVVWECETREPGQLTARLQKLFLRQSKGGKRRSGR